MPPKVAFLTFSAQRWTWLSLLNIPVRHSCLRASSHLALVTTLLFLGPSRPQAAEAPIVASYELLNAIQGLNTVSTSKYIFSFSSHYTTVRWLQSYCRQNGIRHGLSTRINVIRDLLLSSGQKLLLLVAHLLPRTERKILLQFSHPAPEQIMFEMENLEVRIQRTEVEGIYTSLGGLGLEEGRRLLYGVASAKVKAEGSS